MKDIFNHNPFPPEQKLHGLSGKPSNNKGKKKHSERVSVTIRMTEAQRDSVKTRAKLANLSVNDFCLGAVTDWPDYFMVAK